MDKKSFFTNPATVSQQHYEALRAFYVDDEPAQEIATRFKISTSYFKKLRFEFSKKLANNVDPFFHVKKTGPKKRRTKKDIIVRIINLRKQNYAITDIKAAMHADNITLSLDTIDKILKGEGFAPLPKRTKKSGKKLIYQPNYQRHVVGEHKNMGGPLEKLKLTN